MTLERVAVTGGAGFLGRAVCARLLDRGASVRCIDDFSSSDPADLRELTDRGIVVTAQSVVHPIGDDGPVDTVLHLACPASPPDYLAHPLTTLRTGAEGTRHALELAQRHRARFVLASTSEVYGDPLIHPQPETYWGNVNPIGARSVYDESKRFAEAMTMACRRAGANAGVLRIFNTYGPGMRRDDGRLVPQFIGAALAGEPMPVHGDGEQTRSLCYVDDMVEGILAFTDTDLPGPVNLGNPDELSVRRIGEMIADIVGVPARFAALPRMDDDPRRRCPDISRAREQFGWSPTTRVREGLRRTVEWFANAAARTPQPAGREA